MTREAIDDYLPDTEPSASGESRRALKKLEQIVLEGLRHGFFEYTVVCEAIKGRNRRLVIKAGVSHQFVIPIEEIEAIS
jgi:hypothetical protein